MTSRPSDHILRIADLLDRPGASRRVDLSLPMPGDLALELAEVVGPLRLVGVVESVVEGLLVRGDLSTRVRMSCARCLVDVTAPVAAQVVELYAEPARREPGEEFDAGYDIADGTINLDTLLRDALVPAVPYRPLCRWDCAGLCPQCGVNRNDGDCDCVETVSDPRWAVLEGLHLAEGPVERSGDTRHEET